MKTELVKKFLLDLKSDALGSLFCALKEVKRHWFVYFVFFPILAVTGACVLFPSDIEVSSRYAHAKRDNRSQYNLMKKISKYGDFGGVVAVCALTFAAGKMLGRRRLVMAGLAGILAASGAGLLNDLIKLSGRPRPDMRAENHLEDGFYGPKLNDHYWFDSHYMSFASGHTTTAFGGAAGIGLTCPPLAVPAFAVATLVAFSRIYLFDHYPSDVFVGALIGIWFGLAFSMSARKILQGSNGGSPIKKEPL